MLASLECVVSAPGDGKTFYIRQKLQQERLKLRALVVDGKDDSLQRLCESVIFECRIDEHFAISSLISRLEAAFDSGKRR